MGIALGPLYYFTEQGFDSAGYSTVIKTRWGLHEVRIAVGYRRSYSDPADHLPVLSLTRFSRRLLLYKNITEAYDALSQFARGRRLGHAGPFPAHFSTKVFNSKATGIVLCNQLRVMDLQERGAKRIETLPDFIMDQVLARVQTVFE